MPLLPLSLRPLPLTRPEKRVLNLVITCWEKTYRTTEPVRASLPSFTGGLVACAGGNPRPPITPTDDYQHPIVVVAARTADGKKVPDGLEFI
jgi:hypothetical protein